MTTMSVEPDSQHLGNPLYFDALLAQDLFLDAAFQGRIAEPGAEVEESAPVDPMLVCPTCSGEGAVNIHQDAFTGVWDADDCPGCEGTGVLDLTEAFGLVDWTEVL